MAARANSSLSANQKGTATHGSVGQLIDIPTLALQLGVKERFVRRLVHERRVPFHKIGKFIRFHPGDIEQWVTDQRVDQVNDR